jgi:hypothetical protein
LFDPINQGGLLSLVGTHSWTKSGSSAIPLTVSDRVVVARDAVAALAQRARLAEKPAACYCEPGWSEDFWRRRRPVRRAPRTIRATPATAETSPKMVNARRKAKTINTRPRPINTAATSSLPVTRGADALPCGDGVVATPRARLIARILHADLFFRSLQTVLRSECHQSLTLRLEVADQSDQ